MATRKSTGQTPASQQPTTPKLTKDENVLDKALHDAMASLGELEALFHAAGEALCATDGPDPDALIMVGQRVARDAYAAASQASLAAVRREVSHG